MEIVNLFIIILISFIVSFLKSYQVIFLFLLVCIFTHYLREYWNEPILVNVRSFCNNPFGINSKISVSDGLYFKIPVEYFWKILNELNNSFISGRNILFVKSSKNLMETFAPKEISMMAPMIPLGMPNNTIPYNNKMQYIQTSNDIDLNKQKKKNVFVNDNDMLKFLENLKKDN